jgi:cell division protein FtsQ
VVNGRVTKWKEKSVAIFLILLVVGSAYLLGWSSFFTVKNVSVIGAPTTIDASIIELDSQITKGEKLARLDPRVVRSLLKRIIWLDHATVSRSWWNGFVVIRVWPRTPIGTFQGRLIDAAGNIFELPNFAAGNLPLIIAKDHASVQFAISLMTALPANLRSELVGVSVVGLNSAALSLKDPSQKNHKVLHVAWGDASNMDLKVKVYQALIAMPENVNISVIDVSAPHAPIVK